MLFFSFGGPSKATPACQWFVLFFFFFFLISCTCVCTNVNLSVWFGFLSGHWPTDFSPFPFMYFIYILLDPIGKEQEKIGGNFLYVCLTSTQSCARGKPNWIQNDTFKFIKYRYSMNFIHTFIGSDWVNRHWKQMREKATTTTTTGGIYVRAHNWVSNGIYR